MSYEFESLPIKEQKLIKLRNWFNTSYTTYEQMLTRRAYLGIDDKIKDEFRNKTYKSLKDLYDEAEICAKEIKELSK